MPTLERYVISFKEETGIDVQLRAKAINEEIKPVISLAVFRIVQESLNNVLKHAKAKKVSILLEHVNKKLIIIITDNGVGFNTEEVKMIEPESTGGFGLLSMKERVALLEGKVDIVSQVGVGTKITIHIPLLDEGEDSQK